MSLTGAGTRAGTSTGTDRRTTARNRAARYLAPLTAGAVMTALGLWGLVRHNSMGNDEVATKYAATLSLGQLAHLLSNLDAVHGTYYLIMHVWVTLGSSPAMLRVPSLIAMVAGAAMIAVTCTRLTGSGLAGLFAGVIMALTPSISYYAQTARSYALVLACVVAATLALMRALQAEASGEDGRRLRWWWVLYGALVVLSGYLNEMALLILAAHAVTVLAARYGRQAFKHFLVTAVVSAVLVSPLALLSVRERAAVGWIGRPGIRDVGILFHDYFGGTTLISFIIFVFAVAAVLPPRGWQWRHWRERIRKGAPADDVHAAWWERGGVSLPSVALPLLVLPAGLLMAESVVLHPLYVDRYVLYGEAGAALLAGAGCYRVGQWLVQKGGQRLGSAASRRTLLLVAPGVVACLCALVLNLGTQQKIRLPQRSQFDFGTSSAYVGAHAQPGDGVLFINSFYRKARLGYPADFRDVTDFAMAKTPQQVGTYNGTDKALPAVESLMLHYRRIWVVGNVPSAGLSSLQMRDESLLLIHDFRLVAKKQARNVAVTLWVRQ
jgi:mannosyltransferase